MSASTFDFGDGIKYVECITCDEAMDVAKFLMDAGYVVGANTLHRFARLVAQTYSYVGVSEDGTITGWMPRMGSPVMLYADFQQRYRVHCTISNIDDLL